MKKQIVLKNGKNIYSAREETNLKKHLILLGIGSLLVNDPSINSFSIN